ncbi:MT-A70 family methyltransferase [Methanoculleus sp.]|uniref:MT-A70 family methyltransferase n=1 Tax=Methanoculleus sp. TaxID=90427 RepID=UPI0025ECFF64|nr:MT-A70 family methyltransferase [Methanoculleus sp.]MCK9320224.1 MT-A70 family methyltransferase [Methanoculleus sp.]
MKKYEIIYADPAWQYKTKESLAKTSILNGELNSHYGTMTIAELGGLPLGSISDKNSMLFMWVVSPMLDDGIELMKKWGFKYSTIAFIWHKQRANPGHYTMSECEICLVGRRGKIPTPRGARNVRQFLSEMRGKHSAKPTEIRNRIELMFPTQTKLEMFARQSVEGWDAWGNEVENSIDISPYYR